MSDSGLGEDSPSSAIHMNRTNLSAMDRTDMMSGLTNLVTDSARDSPDVMDKLDTTYIVITDNQVSEISEDSCNGRGSEQLDTDTPLLPEGVSPLEGTREEQFGGSVEVVDQCGGRTSVDQLSEHLSLLSTEHDLSQLDEDLLPYSSTIHSSRQSLLSSSSRSSKENLSQSNARSRIPLIPPNSKIEEHRNKFDHKASNTLPRTRILRERQEDKAISQRPSSARESSKQLLIVTSRSACIRTDISRSPVVESKTSAAVSSSSPRGILNSRSPSRVSDSRSPSGFAHNRSPTMSKSRSPTMSISRSPQMSSSRSPGLLNSRSPRMSNSRSISFGSRSSNITSRGSPVSSSPRSNSPEMISPRCKYHRSQSSPARKRQKKVDTGRPLEIWEIQQTLRRGEFIEGVLNVSSKNTTDSFICAPVKIGRNSGHLDWG